MARQPGDYQAPAQAPPVAAATRSEAEAMLVAGAVYRGTVVSRAEDGSYFVNLDAPQLGISGVLLASAVLGGLMGFNIKTKLAPGTSVELAWGKPPFIHCVLPPASKDSINGKNRSLLWNNDTDSGDNFSEVPSDLLDGEFEISNFFGVSMEFLTTLARMGAGDRARVECSLINDMVRVISSQYRHFSGLGEELIFDHGRPTLERSWSSYRHELMNKLKEGEDFTKTKDGETALKGDMIDPAMTEAERLTSIGRYRLLEFMGFAGDFIHSFVADPPETLASMAAELSGNANGAGAGKSWIHRNSDGSLLFQSVADIRLERVCRIPVPFRRVHHEAPDLAESRDYANLTKEYNKLMDFGSVGKRNAYRLAYQIRTYSRWLSRFHSLARMHQLEEYKVPLETDGVPPSWTSAEEDKQRENADTKYYDAYACISILRDGSIVLHDGYGSSIVMSNGNLQLSAARHIDMDAAGDMRVTLGGSLFVKARRGIEMTAETGGILFYCHAWFKALCNAGSVWLRSSADTKVAPVAKGDGPVPELAGFNTDAEKSKPVAVLLEAPAGNVKVRSDSGVGLHVEGVPTPGADDYKTDTHNIELSTKGSVHLQSDRHVMLAASSDVVVSCRRNLALFAPKLYGQVGEMDLSGTLYFSNGYLHTLGVTTKSVTSNNIRSLRKPAQMDPDYPLAKPVEPHLNHVDVLREEVVLPVGQDENAIAARKYALGSTIHTGACPWSSPAEGPTWSFSPSSEYHWDTRDEEKGALVESLTQQFLRKDMTPGSDTWQGPGYATWTWAPNEIASLRRGEPGGFGTRCRWFVSSEGENLHAPSSTEASALAQSPDWAASASVNFQYLKRS